MLKACVLVHDHRIHVTLYVNANNITRISYDWDFELWYKIIGI